MKSKYKRIKYHKLAPAIIKSTEAVFGNNNSGKVDYPRDHRQMFIMGTGRNGSTLLSLILNRHPEIFVPPEQFALPYSIIQWRLSLFTSWKSFARKVVESYEQNNQNWNLDESDYEEVINTSVRLGKPYRKASNIYRLLLSRYSKKRNKNARIFGDQSPNNTFFVKQIQRSFPNAKYVFLVRNPLDVIASGQRIDHYELSDPFYGTWRWNFSIEAYSWLKHKTDSQCLLVKYEDLVKYPDRTIQKVLDFLEAPHRDLLRPSSEEKEKDIMGISHRDFHKPVYQPITTSSVNKWKKELEPELVDQLIPELQENAVALDYEPFTQIAE